MTPQQRHQKTSRKQSRGARLRYGIDAGEEAVVFVVQSSREIERIRVSSILAVTERDSPKPVVNQGVAMSIRDRAEEHTRRIEGVDNTIAKIADEHAPSEVAPGSRSHREAPRRIQIALRCEAPYKIPLQVEDADIAVARPGFFIIPAPCLA